MKSYFVSENNNCLLDIFCPLFPIPAIHILFLDNRFMFMHMDAVLYLLSCREGVSDIHPLFFRGMRAFPPVLITFRYLIFINRHQNYPHGRSNLLITFRYPIFINCLAACPRVRFLSSLLSSPHGILHS